MGAQTGAYIYGEAQFGKGSYNVNETTHSNSHLNANHVLLSSGQDTTLKGATIQGGNRIDAQVGGKLHVESLQDSLEQSSRQTGMGGRVQGGFGSVWSADANYSSDKTLGHRQAVAEQTGLFAGDGGYHIQADSVHFKGGAIASTFHRNELNSNTFSHENIQNQREHEVSSTALSAGWGEKTGGTFSPSLPQKQTGGDDSTTQVVLSEGQIRIGGRETSAAELGIRNQANGAHQTLSAQEDLQAIAQKQKTVAQATAQIQSAVKTYNENRIAQYEQEKAQIAQIPTAQMSPEEQEAFKQKSDSEKEQYYKQHSTTYQQLDQQADSWGTGGANSRAVNVATTAIIGLLGGQNLQQVAMNAGSPYLAETIGNTLSEHGSMPNDWAWLLAHGALGAITAEANGGNATAGALSAAGAELVVSIAAEKLFGDKALDETGKFNADLLSEDEKKQLSALGAATGAVLGMGVGGNSYDAQVGGVVAQNAVENNSLQPRG